MSVRNLSRVFAPDRIAVIGASSDRSSVGGVLLDNLVRDYQGVVYAVNPGHRAVHAMEAYPSIEEVPGTVDLAVICTPAETVPDLVTECGEAGVGGALVISAGFRETGPEGAELERRVAAAAAAFDGFRIVGPNCLGFLVPGLGLNASFARARPRAGHLAFISQSGALATAVLDRAEEQGIGFSAVVSAGNMLDVDFGDLIDHLGQDRSTRALIVYIESITNPRKFMSAARAFSRIKPIVAYKAGRFTESAAAAVSHTGAMAGADDVYAAALRRAGIVRVDEINEIFSTAALLGGDARVHASDLAVVTNAGGPGVIAVDALLERGGTLAALSATTLASLDDVLPPAWSHRNPVDVLGDAGPERYRGALGAVLADDGVAAALAILTPQAMTDATAVAEAVAHECGRSRKPLVAAWMGGGAVREGRERLERAGIPTYETPEQSVGAFMHLVSYARNRETLYETPRTIPVSFTLDRLAGRRLLSAFLPQGAGVLGERQSKALLDAYGIPVSMPLPAAAADEAVAAAEEIGFPVVLKVESNGVTHKTDVGGVVVDVRSPEGVREAYDRIIAEVSRRAPDARPDRVTVQEMVTGPAQELIVGSRKDPTFGAVIMVGAGGIAAEIADDSVLELPPLSERLARRMLERLRVWPLLTGYRGRPAANVDALLEVLMRFSYLVADYPEIAEIEINPLLAGPERAIAVDARIAIDPVARRRPSEPYAHLAIRPYPEELQTTTTLRDGAPVTLRPIKPEDEPAWHDMLAACSEETIRSRFRGLFRHTSHEMATRYCFIDYDREMALVAEAEDAGETRLLGVGRLVADPDRQFAEYAILVADPWQNQGLAGPLTERCLEIARSWGVRTVRAETGTDNRRMLAVLRDHGFALGRGEDPEVVSASLDLGAMPATS